MSKLLFLILSIDIADDYALRLLSSEIELQKVSTTEGLLIVGGFVIEAAVFLCLFLLSSFRLLDYQLGRVNRCLMFCPFFHSKIFFVLFKA
jgi:hypothetical protein